MHGGLQGFSRASQQRTYGSHGASASYDHQADGNPNYFRNRLHQKAGNMAANPAGAHDDDLAARDRRVRSNRSRRNLKSRNDE